MDHALVVYDDDETGEALLADAGEIVAGTGAKLTILALMTPDEFDEVYKTLEVVAEQEQTSYGDSTVLDVARKKARESAQEAFADLDVEYNVLGARVDDAGSEADRVLELAADRDVDHVFISGEKRSPTGKAVFGDRTQSIILNFDGPVTTLLD